MSTDVAVTAADLQAGTLPPVCVLTGEPADDRLAVRFATSSRRLVLIALFSLFWYVVARYATRRTVTGTLPISVRAHAALRRRGRVAVVAWVGGPLAAIAIGVVVAVINANAGATAFIVALTAALLVILVMSYAYIPTAVRGRVDTGAVRSVHLYGVSTEFAAAVEGMYAGRRTGTPPIPDPTPSST